MELKPIRTEVEYKAALKEISPYFDNEPKLGSEESDRFQALALLIEEYESEHFPVDTPDPIEAIKFRMEQACLEAKDLVPAIGSLEWVYEVLNRTRPLSLAMVRNLNCQFGIPTESLIRMPESSEVELPPGVAADVKESREWHRSHPAQRADLKRLAAELGIADDQENTHSKQ